MKTILISGATGLVGQALTKKLNEKGHTVRILSRKDTSGYFHWNPEEGFIDEKAFENLDAIIHLAGASVSKRWTDSYKKEIYDSRIDGAKLLFDTVKKLNLKLVTFITASGVNYYGTFTSDKVFEESDSPANDFLGKVCQAWEKAAFEFETFGTRVCAVRTAVVLSTHGGMLKEISPLTKFNLTSPLGSGEQSLPWIHIDDLIDIYIFLLENSKMKGAFNAVAPEKVTQKEFTQKWMKACGKKIIFPAVPSFALKLVFGEMASILLKGSSISAVKIQDTGFKFHHPKLSEALKDLIKRKK